MDMMPQGEQIEAPNQRRRAYTIRTKPISEDNLAVPFRSPQGEPARH